MQDKLKTRVDGSVLEMEWTFDAPRDRVFAAFTQKEQLEAWWGPEGWITEIKTFEFIEGGIWHYCMRCEDTNQGKFFGMESWGKAIFQKIDAPHSYAHADYFSDASGTISEELPGSENVTIFEDHGNQTRVLFRSDFKTEEAVKQVLEMGMKEGFTSQLHRLDDWLVQRTM
jgi:uncharacterized protein YndB with AHSA1/START domain